jgi:flagellar hook-associated protein 2
LNKIAKVEQKGLDKYEEKISKVDNKLKLVRDLKTKFNDIKDATKPFSSVQEFRDLVGVSSNPEVAAPGAIDKNVAKPGSYEFEVLELAQSNSLITKGFPDRDRAEVGVGYITFKTPDGEDKDIYINSENNTLDGVAHTINEAGLGVHAEVVNDGTDSEEPYRLIITGDKSGWKNNMQWPEFNFLDGDFDLDQDAIREAKSAKIRFEGHEILVDENTVKNLIPGVNIDLKKAKPGETVKIQIKPDFEKIEGKAKNFVDKINAVLTFIQGQNPTGPDSWKDPKKALSGDVSLQLVEMRLRNLIQKSEAALDTGNVQRLRDMGIVFNRNGTLDYDGKKFQSVLENNFDQVARFFSGNGPLAGFSTELNQLVDSITRSGDGSVTIREKNLQDEISRTQKQRDDATDKAQKRLDKAQAQFARAEQAISQLQSVQGSIAQGIPAMGGGGAAASASGGGGAG